MKGWIVSCKLRLINSTKSTTKVGKYLLQVVCLNNMNFNINLTATYICLDLTICPSFHEFH